MGYNTQSKGYKVDNLQMKKLMVNRDVEVDENASWNWEAKKVQEVVEEAGMLRYASVTSTTRFFTRVYSKMSKILGAHI